ncbi:hypothetical protein AMAG_05787 [Allomyces macrogynus ATCC 38327]|uniref:Secreted protein n=1 Tax=Allomyces macrogynus (strain ATCC 38327) TaxID=578462 RepID=A0A0L0SD72_ALLM3|nr:hypothetical protein, variant [Allomyces macrogynus ATCC 38327]KNE60398.1 hypothetical protein AMAG_05787 [Allomyces macrogynus ATCC 38327]|eukprot:KNE60397.1 hypothetical protein, variant [Allomyces macrogynus ATCC 38327]
MSHHVAARATCLTLAVVLLSALAASAAPTNAPPLGVRFTSGIPPALIAESEKCAAAVARVDIDPTIAACFPQTPLWFAAVDQVCHGVRNPGAPANAACAAALHKTARDLATACRLDLVEGDRMATAYLAWGNAAAATDACTSADATDDLALTRPTTVLEAAHRVYSEWFKWRILPDDPDTPQTDTAKRALVCTPAVRRYWQHVEAVGDQPAVYLLTMTSDAAFVKDVHRLCPDFVVPPPTRTSLPVVADVTTATAAASAAPVPAPEAAMALQGADPMAVDAPWATPSQVAHPLILLPHDK